MVYVDAMPLRGPSLLQVLNPARTFGEYTCDTEEAVAARKSVFGFEAFFG